MSSSRESLSKKVISTVVSMNRDVTKTTGQERKDMRLSGPERSTYMESQTGLSWVAPKERFDSSMVKLWFESTALLPTVVVCL